MPTCPNGHESTATDYCDTCGVQIAPPAEGPAASPDGREEAAGEEAAGGRAAGEEAGGEEAGGGDPCPSCGAARTARFCESCGYDFETGALPPPPPPPPPAAEAPAGAEPAGAAGAARPAEPAPATTWTAVVAADRQYYESVVAVGGPDAASIEFPAYCPERRFVLTGAEMRIGRRSASRGLEPEIDLTGPPRDPGVSHLHAVLGEEEDGTWTVLDPGSSNGTQVNGADIATGQKVPLHDGDRIEIGAWTVLTVHTA